MKGSYHGRTSRNVSVILSPEEKVNPANRCLVQVRDDVKGNPLQFFGGKKLMKHGFKKKQG